MAILLFFMADQFIHQICEMSELNGMKCFFEQRLLIPSLHCIVSGFRSIRIILTHILAIC